MIGYTQAMNKELANDGIKSVALCPGFVETPMTEFVQQHLNLSPNCVVPEIVFQRPNQQV